MITLYVREHGTHNRGYSFDFIADLDNYTSKAELLEDLYEYTRKQLERNGITDYNDEMEEWLITDWEFENDDLRMRFNEYADIQKLIDRNEELNQLTEFDIKLLSAYVSETGETFENTLEKVKDSDIYYFEGNMEDWAYEMVEEGLFGEINERIINYIDYEKLARDISMDGYIYSEKYNLSFNYC